MVTKKKSGNFDYFKPQNGAAALMLSQSNSSDSADSDSKGMFSLPKRRIIRPKGRRTGPFSCCRYCCVTVLPVVAALAFVALVSCLIFLLLGMNGLQRDLELIRLRINQVEADDDSNLQSSTKLQQDLNGKLAALASDERYIKELQEKLTFASHKIAILNQTIMSMKLHMTKAGSVASLSSDVNELKKGMADTGVEITKLTDEQNKLTKEQSKLKERNSKLVTIVKTINQKMFNVTAKLLAQSAMHAGFPPVQHFEEPSVKLRNLAGRVVLLMDQVKTTKTDWRNELKNHSNYMKLELYKLYSYVDVVNTTCNDLHGKEYVAMQVDGNATAAIKLKVDALTTTVQSLLASDDDHKNSSSSAAGVVLYEHIRTLTDVVDQQRQQLTNMSSRVAYLEQLAARALSDNETEEALATPDYTTPSALSIIDNATNSGTASEPVLVMTTSPTLHTAKEGVPFESMHAATEESFEGIVTSGPTTLSPESPSAQPNGREPSILTTTPASEQVNTTASQTSLVNTTALPSKLPTVAVNESASILSDFGRDSPAVDKNRARTSEDAIAHPSQSTPVALEKRRVSTPFHLDSLEEEDGDDWRKPTWNDEADPGDF